MAESQCPVCITTLESRDVTPCVICGGWPESLKRFSPEAVFNEWRLPSGQVLTLCHACELEEFMVPGGWAVRLGIDRGPAINALQFVRELAKPLVAKDKFCPQCNLRFAFLEVLVSVAN